MRAEVLAGYDRSELEETDSLDELPHEYPFCLIKILAEPSGGSEKRVATYVELRVSMTKIQGYSSRDRL